MTLESNLNPNDIDPPPRIMGSLVLIHAVSGLCCGVFGLIQMAQPDFFATQLVLGYEGPDVPQAIKLVGILAMAPLPLLVILEAMAGIGLITASRQAVARLRWWSIFRALLAAFFIKRLGLAAPIGVGLWLMGGRGTRLQERLDMWRVATGGRP